MPTANDAVVAALSAVPEVQQVSSNLSASRPYVAVTVDRARPRALGLSEVAVGYARQRRAAADLDRHRRDRRPDADHLPGVGRPAGDGRRAGGAAGPDPRRSGAAVSSWRPSSRRRGRFGDRRARPAGRDDQRDPGRGQPGAANTAVQQALDATTLPAGVTASLGGVTADQSEAFSQLGLALLVGVLVVYVVMVATFRSLLQPLLLLVSIPFAATGAILLQIVTGVPLGVPSLIGVLMLIGIVVTNAIVLVDLINQYRERGMSVRDAVDARRVPPSPARS